MPPRTRPIEKFAQAVGKCSAEVNYTQPKPVPFIAHDVSRPLSTVNV